MKLLYLTFYFEPDLCPGSFRSTALIAELARQLSPDDHIHVITTQPNRYRSFAVSAPEQEQRAKAGECPVAIDRIPVPAHASGFLDQIRSFVAYYRAVHRLTKPREYELVVASSSRLFTAFLGARVARRGFARPVRRCGGYARPVRRCGGFARPVRRCGGFARRVRNEQPSIPLFLDIRDLFRETILELLGYPSRLILRPILRAIEHYTFGSATHINLVSEGFKPYFDSFSKATYSYFTNGIDDEFLDFPLSDANWRGAGNGGRTILYAGNIGEGQGLHHIIPQAARLLGEQYQFVVIGDGGARTKLERAIQAMGVKNVELRNPICRDALLSEYRRADYLFVHLNDLEAFKRVLPSKLFEYGATDKPILAGVSGYAAQFIHQHLTNCLLFNPGDVDGLVAVLRQTPYQTQTRTAFIRAFRRKTIMQKLARQILKSSPLSSGTPVRHRPNQPERVLP